MIFFPGSKPESSDPIGVQIITECKICQRKNRIIFYVLSRAKNDRIEHLMAENKYLRDKNKQLEEENEHLKAAAQNSEPFSSSKTKAPAEAKENTQAEFAQL